MHLMWAVLATKPTSSGMKTRIMMPVSPSLPRGRLRQLIETPILMGEHVRTLEPKVDMVIAGATDYMRVNPTWTWASQEP